MQEGQHALSSVGSDRDEHQDRQQAQTDESAQITFRHAESPHLRQHDESDDHRRPKVSLSDDQQPDDPIQRKINAHTFGRRHLVSTRRHVAGPDEDQRELRELRGLQADRAESQPRLVPLASVRSQGGQHHYEHQADDGVGQPAELAQMRFRQPGHHR